MCLSMLMGGGQPDMPPMPEAPPAAPPERFNASAQEAGAQRTAQKQRALAASGLAAARPTGPRGLTQSSPNMSLAQLLGQTPAMG